jgi:hypothetical protein
VANSSPATTADSKTFLFMQFSPWLVWRVF